MFLKRRTDSWAFFFVLLAAQNVDMRARAPAAIQGHGATLRTEAIYVPRIAKQKKRSHLKSLLILELPYQPWNDYSALQSFNLFKVLLPLSLPLTKKMRKVFFFFLITASIQKVQCVSEGFQNRRDKMEDYTRNKIRRISRMKGIYVSRLKASTECSAK